tara:strand:- start:437 stop:595 length:159 start_codon:yes stop_codon:yes gene_type:complete
MINFLPSEQDGINIDPLVLSNDKGGIVLFICKLLINLFNAPQYLKNFSGNYS